MIASIMLWVAAFAFAIFAIGLAMTEQEEATKQRRDIEGGTSLLILVLIALALVAAHVA